MPLKVTRRKESGSLTIEGTVAGQRIRRRAASDNPRLAAEEAAALEAEILRTEWHGERRGSRTFAEAALSYIEASPRAPSTLLRIDRILKAFGPDVRLRAVDQESALRLRTSLLRQDSGAATYLREIITPLRAIMAHAHALGWCDMPHFVTPAVAGGRTLFVTPDEAERLILAAAPHIKPLLTFLVCTGARMSEALELEWRDVDLNGARAIFWRTKNGQRRVAQLQPRTVVILAALACREGRVFRHEGGAYSGRDRGYGGQIKSAWAGALRRSGLNPELTPHNLRHTWATWHYALHKDLLSLKEAGGWSSVTLVERYAHLMPVGQEPEIRAFLGERAHEREIA